jgi:myo-inositol-1(or 4)-monophosphatase
VDSGRIRDVAVAAAARAGDVLCGLWGKAHQVEKKGAIDLVTEADLASEKAIHQIIKRAFPNHAILAEEGGVTLGSSPYEWIIDPLDGTTNYAHHLPEFSVSIGLAREGEMVFGLILSPVMGELFCAMQGEGATLNGRPIHVSGTRTMAESLLVTGFPYDLPPVAQIMMSRLARCILAAQGVRRLGSAALDLCYVASGRFDGFWEQNLAPWDTAAGMVIVREAGGKVTDFSNAPFSINGNEILATNGHIHKEMREILSL